MSEGSENDNGPAASTGFDFEKHKRSALEAIEKMTDDVAANQADRQGFFNAVYQNAKGDAAFVPWADMKAKTQLEQWLAANGGLTSSATLTAIDVACGLGDNAEAIASAGYKTTGFDLASDAIEWVRRRFPNSNVTYQTADLFDLPKDWLGAFDLVHECYTLQALPPEMVERTAAAVASLVKPGGTLLIFTRVRENGSDVDGPPWPLEERELDRFQSLGFEKKSEDRFTNTKKDRSIPHAFIEWRKTGEAE